MNQSPTPTMPVGTAQSVSTYMLQWLGTSGAGISYWKSGPQSQTPAVPLHIVTQSGLDSFTPAEVAAIGNAAATWSWVCNLTFVPDGDGIIVRPSNQDATALNYSGGIDPEVGSGPIKIANVELNTKVRGISVLGTANFRNVVHELGHGIGLDHTGAYNGEQSQAGYLPGTVFQTDTMQYAVMSYNVAALTGANVTVDGTTYNDSTPMLYDIFGAQRLYGAPDVDPAGSTTFGFNVSAGLPISYDFTKNVRPVLTIYSHTGHNTLDLSGFVNGSIIDLHSGAFSSFAGMTNNAAIYYTTKVDTLIEGNGANTVYANDDPDSIVGGTGANTIFLGRGADTVQSGGHDTIIAGAGELTARTSGDALLFAGAGNDTISVVSGSLQAFGGSGRLTVRNVVGNVTVQAGAGGSTVDGGPGRVTAWGRAAGDAFFGGQFGGNTLVGGAAAETLVGGGAGDLLIAAPSGGDLLAAGPGNVTLTGAGSTGANTYFGGSGASVIATGAGDDTVMGGSGAATIFGGSGHTDIFAGGGPSLVIAGPGGDYVQAGTGQATVLAGTGADLFGFVSGHGGSTELIVGFKPGADLIALQGFGPDAVAAALQTAQVVGKDTTIHLADDTRITFANFTELSKSLFA